MIYDKYNDKTFEEIEIEIEDIKKKIIINKILNIIKNDEILINKKNPINYLTLYNDSYDEYLIKINDYEIKYKKIFIESMMKIDTMNKILKIKYILEKLIISEEDKIFFYEDLYMYIFKQDDYKNLFKIINLIYDSKNINFDKIIIELLEEKNIDVCKINYILNNYICMDDELWYKILQNIIIQNYSIVLLDIVKQNCKTIKINIWKRVILLLLSFPDKMGIIEIIFPYINFDHETINTLLIKSFPNNFIKLHQIIIINKSEKLLYNNLLNDIFIKDFINNQSKDFIICDYIIGITKISLTTYKFLFKMFILNYDKAIWLILHEMKLLMDSSLFNSFIEYSIINNEYLLLRNNNLEPFNNLIRKLSFVQRINQLYIEKFNKINKNSFECVICQDIFNYTINFNCHQNHNYCKNCIIKSLLLNNCYCCFKCDIDINNLDTILFIT